MDIFDSFNCTKVTESAFESVVQALEALEFIGRQKCRLEVTFSHFENA